ncbi:MAG TPA: 50S ribosomal protein L9, partial [bacterium]|nr:50S ribosomal protein L9 [bacterium]
ITKKAGDEGKLYGSVTTSEVAIALREQLGISLDKRDLTLPEGAIKVAGEHPAVARLYTGVNANFVVTVNPE